MKPPPRNSLGSRTVSVPLDGARCKVCNEPAVHHHHVVSQQRLDRVLTREEAKRAKADIRGVIALCFSCHDKAESGTLHFEAHEIHPGFAAYVREYDLAAVLPRYMTSGAAQTNPRDERRGTVVSSDGSPRRNAA